ncbi:uncharacterized protein [Atheta coriaria]|uniref:uncharacterized protein n=1 Tax=Dalotia coriaria TaxID=877792 RepID=UPI0031F465F4
MSDKLNETLHVRLAYLTSHINNQPVFLNNVKDMFQSQIASIRSLQRITNVKELAKLLKKRDLLTTSCLDSIAYMLPPDLYQEYSKIKGAHQVTIHPHMSSNNHRSNISNIIGSTSEERDSINLNGNLDKIYRIICGELSPQHCKDMARKLCIKECHIDELFLCSTSTHECIKKVLQMHEENCDPKTWRQSLLNALDGAKREDVRKMVERKLDDLDITRPYKL